MPKSPLVSVIIPTFNRAYVVHKAIESVLAQTYKNYELIVVDDGSEDNTDEIITAYKQVIYIKKTHEGQAEARNAGLKIAKGEYIASLDSDDVWKENYLSQSLAYILDNQLDMFFSNWEYYLNDSNNWINALEISLNKKYTANTFYLFNYQEFRTLLIKDSIAPSSGHIIRKSFMSPTTWHKGVYSDDSFLQIELMVSNPNCQVGFTNETLWKKNRSADSICDGRISVDYRKQRIEDLELMISKLEPFLTPKERKITEITIIQNHIYIVYLLLSGGKFDKKNLRESLREILNKPLFSFTALLLGLKKYFKQKIAGIK